jgi:hypothetical protein
MSTLNRDYDDVLRRALHVAAESIEPSADGLERIRARLGTPPALSFASALAWYSEMATRLVAWAAPIIRAALEAFWSIIDRFRPAAAEPGRGGPHFGWLRPMAAMGTAIFVVAAGAFAIMTLPQAISSSGSASFLPWVHPTGPVTGAGNPGLNGGNASKLTNPGPTGPGGFGYAPSTAPPASRCSALGSSRTGSATPTPSMPDSSSPSAPASSGPTSASPSVTPSDTPTAPVSSAPPTSISSTPDPGSVSTPSPSSSAGVVGGVTSGTATPEPESAIMLPTSSTSTVPKSPCPSSSPKKKKQKTAAPLAAGGLAAQRVTVSGVKE